MPPVTRGFCRFEFGKGRNIVGGQFEIFKDMSGKYRWRLAHKSGIILADSVKAAVPKKTLLLIFGTH